MRILQVGTNKRSGKAAKPRLAVYGLLLLAVALMAVAGIGGGAAFAADVQHGISLTKGCVSPTAIGDPYTCTYSFRNIVDEAQDTLTVNSLIDVVHAQGGDVSSGNVLSSLSLTIGPFARRRSTRRPVRVAPGSAATARSPTRGTGPRCARFPSGRASTSAPSPSTR